MTNPARFPLLPMNMPTQVLPSFDPRQVPIIAVDSASPAVPLSRMQPQALVQRFQSPPQWQPEITHEKKFMQRNMAHAAVLIPLIRRENGLTVLLTQRTAHLSTHSGQIAFPGGKTDEADSDPGATALREAHEEVGLEHRHVQIIGVMPHYTTGSSFIITPIVALVEPGFTLTPNPHEVAATFEVPLSYLMTPAHHRRHALEWDNQRREWWSIPYQDSNNGDKEWYIWGATAAMLRNLYRFLII